MAPKKSSNVTLSELGKRLNLTPMAISIALNDKESTARVSQKTRKRVKALAKRLNYRPNRLAQTLRTGKSEIVGVLAFQNYGYHIQQKLSLARHHVEKHGLIPNIYLSKQSSIQSSNRAVEVMMDAKVDALMLFNDLGKSAMNRLQKARIPLVTISAPTAVNVPRYLTDYKGGTILLTNHVIDQGSSKIAFLYQDTSSQTILDALEGFKAAVKDARQKGKSISPNVHPIKCTFAGEMVKGLPNIHGLYAVGYLGMQQLIRSKQVPDALICSGDALAHGALLACARAGIRIPQDMLITGFGDDPLSSAGLLPLTSVHQPIEELCRMAFDDLMIMMTTGETFSDRCVILPFELVIRESTQRNFKMSF